MARSETFDAAGTNAKRSGGVWFAATVVSPFEKLALVNPLSLSAVVQWLVAVAGNPFASRQHRVLRERRARKKGVRTERMWSGVGRSGVK